MSSSYPESVMDFANELNKLGNVSESTEVELLRRRLEQGKLLENVELADRVGELEKKGNSVKTWKHRYFCLYASQKRLDYYRCVEDVGAGNLVGRIDLSNAVAKIPGPDEGPKRPNAFFVHSPAAARTYVMQAASATERDEWIAAVNASAQTPGASAMERIGVAGPRDSVADDGGVYSYVDGDEDDSDGLPAYGRSHAVGSGNHTGGDASLARIFREVPVRYEGWARKRGGTVRTWKRRYLVLRQDNCTLRWSTQEVSPEEHEKGWIPVAGAKVRVEEGLRFVLVTADRDLWMEAETDEDRNEWIEALSDVINLAAGNATPRTPPPPRDAAAGASRGRDRTASERSSGSRSARKDKDRSRKSRDRATSDRDRDRNPSRDREGGRDRERRKSRERSAGRSRTSSDRDREDRRRREERARRRRAGE